MITDPGDQWDEVYDEVSGSVYYSNRRTGESSWENPGAIVATPQAGGDSNWEASLHFSDEAAGKGGEEWVNYWDDEVGANYWYNKRTGDASWQDPRMGGGGGGGGERGSEWVQQLNPDTGREYWYNTLTGESDGM